MKVYESDKEASHRRTTQQSQRRSESKGSGRLNSRRSSSSDGGYFNADSDSMSDDLEESGGMALGASSLKSKLSTCCCSCFGFKFAGRTTGGPNSGSQHGQGSTAELKP